jgi:hypothetical protein
VWVEMRGEFGFARTKGANAGLSGSSMWRGWKQRYQIEQALTSHVSCGLCWVEMPLFEVRMSGLQVPVSEAFWKPFDVANLRVVENDQ